MYPFAKTFRSLTEANLLSLMLASALLAIVVVVAGMVSITWIAASMITIKIGWLDMLINFIIGILSGIGGWFMLPALTVLISGMFQEKAIARVEHVYYPEAVRHDKPRFWPDIVHDIKFTVWALFLNIMVLPLYFFGIGFIVSILLNSYLVGREFFESAAGYHIGKSNAKNLIPKNRKVIYTSGFIITVMALIPLLNLFIPIIAVVWMVHIYHYISFV
ncbi:MAG: EI24 domain-containing protein [bacterium]